MVNIHEVIMEFSCDTYAYKYRFFHRHHDLIHTLHLELLQSCDGLLLSEFPFSARSFWQWPAIVTSIIEGAYNVINCDVNSKLLHGKTCIRQVVDDAICRAEAQHGRVQKEIYLAVHKLLHSNPIAPTLLRRAKTYFPASSHNSLHLIDYN